MQRGWSLCIVIVLFCSMAPAQGVIGDVLAGKLVNPKVGAWAWYDLTDAATGRRYVVRHAIVGKEKVDRKTGYWVELEVVPRLGHKSIYKMLLTGPANEPKNVHKILFREGPGPVQQAALGQDSTETDEGAPEVEKPERKTLGKEDVPTLGGTIPAEHFELTTGGHKLEVWLNEDVRPMGIVRMKSADGDLILRNYGAGGPDARSMIDDVPEVGTEESRASPEFRVYVEGAPKQEEPQGETP